MIRIVRTLLSLKPDTPDLNQSFGDAEIVMSWVNQMVARYGGTRDIVLRQCAGVEAPQDYWRDLQRQADSYVPGRRRRNRPATVSHMRSACSGDADRLLSVSGPLTLEATKPRASP